MQNRVVYLDCYDGITAPLFLGALFDIGLDIEALKKAMATLPLPAHTITSQKQDVPVSGRSAGLALDAPEKAVPWRLADTPALLPPGTLEEPVRQPVLAMVQHLAQATSKLRNLSIEDVTLPDITPLLWLITLVLGLNMLNLDEVYVSPLPMSAGSHQGSRGQEPALLPEVLEMLIHAETVWYNTVGNEHVSLEAAAFMSEMTSFEPVNIHVTQAGYGCSSERSGNVARSLRLCLGNLFFAPERISLPAPVQTTLEQIEAETDWVTVLETNIDNMSGELLGGLLDHLLELGALDVSYTPMQMKKNRPATLIRVITPPDLGEQLAMTLLRETTTLGVRFQHMQRLKARREPRTIQTPFGPMLVKVKYLGERLISASPEYEECARVAREHNIPLADVYEVARSAVQTLIIGNRKKA